MATLKIRDAAGNIIEIPAIKGDPFTYDDFTEEQLEALKVKGEPGPMPVKGTDYFTKEDKKEIVNEVLEEVKYTALMLTSWEEVKEIVRKGLAGDRFKVGITKFECSHSDYGTLTWDVIGIDDEDLSNDPDHSRSVTLQLHYCITGPGYFDENKSNIWKDSDIQTWLNSEDGFLSGLDKDFLDVISPVSKKTMNKKNEDGFDTTDDKFFLLSLSEVYGGENRDPYDDENATYVSEGDPYPYYEMYSDLSSASLNTDINRVKYLQDNTATKCNWYLRSMHNTSTISNIRVVTKGNDTTNPGGNISSSASNNTSHKFAPACCILG